MDEHLTFVLFLLVPVLAGVAIFYFARHLRQRASKADWRQLLLGNLLVLTFLVSILFVGAEAYYRFIYDTTDSLNCTKVSERWFTRYYHQNAAGWRDDLPYNLRPPKSLRRLTFVGDSFTSGHGVEDFKNLFPFRIRPAHPEWEIHVFASPGFDTAREMDVLNKSFDLGYQIDEVVLIYCLNDITDILPESQEAYQRFYSDVDSSGWLRRNSYFLNTFWPRLTVMRDPYFKNYFDILQQAYHGPAWDEQQRRLTAFRNLVQTNGGHLSVISFPFLNALGPDYKFAPEHQALDSFWRSLNVPHLDLLPLYRDLPAKKITVNQLDAHPNEYAHALAAEVIEKFLAAQMATNPPPQRPAN